MLKTNTGDETITGRRRVMRKKIRVPSPIYVSSSQYCLNSYVTPKCYVAKKEVFETTGICTGGLN
jgi:hypothetical protein